MGKENLNITPRLRGLAIGMYTTFPCSQRTSVMTIVSRLKKELAKEGWNCRIQDLKESYEVRVTRIS